MTQAVDKRPFVLRDKAVSGKLDLRHRKIDGPVEIHDCEFLDEVDLRYSEFAHAVDLSGCTFRKSFNSGDHVESHAVYRKDLVCNGTTFESVASFNGCQVKGSAYFSGADFRSSEERADFGAMSVGKTYECSGAAFEGPASFATLECGGTAFFDRCRFGGPGPVLFSSAKFGNNLVCDDAIFSGRFDAERMTCGGGAVFRRARFLGTDDANFVQISVGGSLECQEALFEGMAVFNSVECGLSGFFNKAMFCGPVEFGFARFGGVFDCPAAHFGGWANFSSLKCASVDCNDAIFYAPANFNLLDCHGSGHFERTKFRGEYATATFRYSTFAQNVVCDQAVFEGSAIFASMKCGGNAFFDGARFGSRHEISFKQAVVGGNLECQNIFCDGSIIFESLRCHGHLVIANSQLRDANFGFASIGQTLACIGTTVLGSATFDRLECRNLNCQNTQFDGPVALNSLACADGGAFNDARFYGETRFGHASFGISLSCDRTVFRAKADFDSLRCGASAFFRQAEFDDVDFRHASLGKGLSCQNAVFNGLAAFQELECGGSAFFEKARFLGYDSLVSWAGASFSGNLNCSDTLFNGRVSLNRTSCQGSALFEGTRFMTQEVAHFEFSNFGRNLSFRGATFTGPVDLTMMHVARRLDMSAARFREEVCFYGARVGVLALDGEPFPFEQEGLDLREFGFEGFLGDDRLADAFARAQDPAKFSRDPFLQLESYYSGAGDEAGAKAIHYRGRRDVRENAKNRRGATEWSFWTKLGDFFLKYLTGYGARSWLLLMYIAFFVAAGAVVFGQQDAVALRAPSGVVAQPMPSAVLMEGAEPRAEVTLRRPLEPFAYSLDLFLPLVNLHYDDKWQPEGQWRASYALVHAMAGWLLIPLLVASLSGIVRRQ